MRTKSGKKTPINQGTIDETLAGKSERGESITVKNEDFDGRTGAEFDSSYRNQGGTPWVSMR